MHTWKWLEVEAARRGQGSIHASTDGWSSFGLAFPHLPKTREEPLPTKPARRDRSSRYNTVGADSGYGSTLDADHTRLSTEVRVSPHPATSLATHYMDPSHRPNSPVQRS